MAHSEKLVKMKIKKMERMKNFEKKLQIKMIFKGGS